MSNPEARGAEERLCGRRKNALVNVPRHPQGRPRAEHRRDGGEGEGTSVAAQRHAQDGSVVLALSTFPFSFSFSFFSSFSSSFSFFFFLLG